MRLTHRPLAVISAVFGMLFCLATPAVAYDPPALESGAEPALEFAEVSLRADMIDDAPVLEKSHTGYVGPDGAVSIWTQHAARAPGVGLHQVVFATLDDAGLTAPTAHVSISVQSPLMC